MLEQGGMADHDPEWCDAGDAAELAGRELQEILLNGKTRIALSHRAGAFHAVSGVCNHVGGPLGQGRLDGDYLVCPWHGWKFHHATGEGEPGFEADRVPRHATRVEGGRLFVSLKPLTQRSKLPHPPHPLATLVRRGEPGGPPMDAPLRVAGISTTNMDLANPRASTSEMLLTSALERARARGAETRLIRLGELKFRACEGYYSKAARACTWPCSITQMDATDQMDQVYEAFTQWADVFLIATPIRWGQASSLYYKMVERMNCIQNQETIAGRVLLRDKIVGLIVTGGQDNIQAVVGQMMTFFGELGCQFPQFPFIAHSRGWSREDMENNVRAVRDSASLHEGAGELAERCLDTARALLDARVTKAKVSRGGRKASRTDAGAGD
jgi:multimeric flavodoxin WrbA/nitrite reductase/ring-hydroxylating ferredoxin subunit